jgi:hypothetical protein
MVRVWVDDWQMACCGTSFSVGARVTWTVSAEIDTEWLAQVVGSETAESINFIEDHHFDETAEPVTISATVAAIEAVQCDFAARPGESASWPVEGSDTRAPVAYAPRWVPDEEPRRFVGWLVELEHDYLIPTDPVFPPRGHHSAA